MLELPTVWSIVLYGFIPSGIGLLSILLVAPRLSATKYALAVSQHTLFQKFRVLPVPAAKAVAYGLGALLLMLGVNLAMASRSQRGDDIRIKALEWRAERNFYLTALAFLCWWMISNVFDLLLRCHKQEEVIENLKLQLELRGKTVPPSAAIASTTVEKAQETVKPMAPQIQGSQGTSVSKSAVSTPSTPGTQKTKPPLLRQASGVHVELLSKDKEHLAVPVARMEDAGTVQLAKDIGLPEPEITITPAVPVAKEPLSSNKPNPTPLAHPVPVKPDQPGVVVGETVLHLDGDTPTCHSRPASPEVDQPDHYVAEHADEKGILPSLPPLDTKTMHQEEWGAWGPVDASAFKVRGKTYLRDRIKIPAVSNLFDLAAVELGSLPHQVDHMAARKDSYIHKLHASQPNMDCPPFFLVVNFMTPHVPSVNLTMYLRAPASIKGFYSPEYQALAKSLSAAPLPDKVKEGKQEGSKEGEKESDDASTQPENEGFMKLLHQFLAKGDDFRTACFKFIPRVVEGSWIVKKSVGQQPVILGNKLKQTYHYDANLNYMEIDVDVASSRVGTAMWKLTNGFASTLIIDLAVLLEGHSSEELPERLLGGVRLSHLDMTKLPQLTAE